MRPHQWTKNGAVFVGIVFAQKLGDTAVMLPVGLLFVAFCLVSSTVYLINDLRDREEDAQHPVKCKRPIAAGLLAVNTAWAAAGVLAISALGLAWFIGRPELPDDATLGFVHHLKYVPPGVVAVGVYLTLNLAYTGGLKKQPIADITCVALGFLIRVVSGPAVAGLFVSPWLFLCTFFGALFLASAKRRGELAAVEAGKTKGRSVLRLYPPRVLDILVGMAATATLLTYSIYTVADQTVIKFHTTGLMYTVPIVFLGLGRYLILLYGRGEGEDPSTTLFKDRVLLLTILSWILVSGMVIGFAPDGPNVAVDAEIETGDGS